MWRELREKDYESTTNGLQSDCEEIKHGLDLKGKPFMEFQKTQRDLIRTKKQFPRDYERTQKGFLM